MRTELRIAGFGGQGVITLGTLLGRAAVVHDHKQAVLTEDYGPEKTGGWSRADLVVSNEEIGYPMVEHPDIFVALSLDGYQRFRATAKPGALVLLDPEMVRLAPGQEPQAVMIPARKTAEALGARVAANLVMAGAVVELSRIVSVEAAQAAVRTLPKRGAKDVSEPAFERGRGLAREARP